MPLSRANFAALGERLADLLERLLFGHVFGQAVRPHLHARRAEVVRQLDPLLRLVDVLADDRRVGEWNSHVVPSPPILTGEPSNCFLTSARCAGVSVDLDAVLVRRPQLDARRTRLRSGS